MEEVMPLQRVKNNFKTKILKLLLKFKRDLVSYYQAQTTFGKMTLIVEQFQSKNSSFQTQQTVTQYLIQTRNTLIKNECFATPLIYEQQIVRVQQNLFICLTLTEPFEIVRRSQLVQFKELNTFQDLVMSVYKVSKTPFKYEQGCYGLQWVFRSDHTQHLSFDFTRIIERPQKQQQDKDQTIFQLFKKQFCKLMMQARSGRMKQLLFIKQKAVDFNYESVLQAKNEFDLALLFNLLPSEKVLVIYQTKEKTFPINKLQGRLTIQFQHKRYQNLNFQSGFRIDGFTQLSYERLKKQFFEEKIIYKIFKNRYQVVVKTPISRQSFCYLSSECWIKHDIQFSDLILVDQEINKAEFISFLIGYFKHIEPTLNLITFHKDQNAIRIEHVNKSNKVKTVLMKFHPKYTIKDQQICMIIQKAKLKNTLLSLERMMITDSFLMFLANCDKTLHINQLNISYCQLLSDSAIHSLYASPLCQNLKVLKISSLPIINFSAVKFKKNLKELTINQCTHHQEILSFSGWNIQKLQAIGVNLSMDLPSTLKHLQLSNEIQFQNLRNLRNLELTHLKIKIVQNKKNISNFFNSLSIKQSASRVFAQGYSRNTLKYFDISGSKIKIKELAPILLIQSLQTFVCEDIERQKFGEFSLPQHIMNLSFKNSPITADILNETTQRTIIIIKLNLCGTAVSDSALAGFVKTRKYINLLEIAEQQLTFALLQKKSGIQTLKIHLNKIIRDQHEHFLNKMLIIQTETSKQLNLACCQKLEPKLIAKVNRFFKFYQVKIDKLTENFNLFINSIPFWKHIIYKYPEETYEHFSIINPHALHHKIKLHPINLINANKKPTFLNLQLFNISLHKYLTLYPQSLLDISIRSNRILGSLVVDMIYKCAGDTLRSFDFRDCIFKFVDVKDTIYSFSKLQIVNEGQYQLQMDEQENCQEQMQKILKFYMKLSRNQKMKLKIKVQEIKQRELFYSILYQIINQFQKNIVSLHFQFTNMSAQFSQIVWSKVFNLPKIQTLKISYFNNKVIAQQFAPLYGLIDGVNNLNLFALQIATNLPFLLPSSLSSKSMKKMRLQFCQLPVSENIIPKLLRNLPSLVHVDIRMTDSQIMNLTKLQDSIQRMMNLTHLSLNFENCPLKQQQICQFVSNLCKNKLLQRLQLNINNISMQIAELIKACETLQKQNKFCHIVAYSIQSKKQIYNKDQSELVAKGIQIFHNQ